MKVGVTGASGHIGNVVCRTLVERGEQVKALYHSDTTALKELEVEKVQVDITNKEDVERFVKGCDVIIHSAAIISIHGDSTGLVHKTNSEGTTNVVEACSTHGVKKLIHLSSVEAVQEQPLDAPFDETRPYKQKGDYEYDYSKALGEQIVIQAIVSGAIEGCILRPSSVMGVHDYKPSETGKALMDFYNRKIPLLPQGGFNFVDVRDVSDSIVAAIEKGRNGEVYQLSGEYYTLKSISQIVHEVTGIKTPKKTLPFWFLRAVLPFVKLYGKLTQAAPLFTKKSLSVLKLGHPSMDNSKARKELNHRVRPLEQTLKDFYDWQIARGTLKKKP